MRRRQYLHAVFFLVCIIVLYTAYWLSPQKAVSVSFEEILVDGKTRQYRLVVPDEISDQVPVVFAFHGLGDSPDSMANYSRLDQLASKEQFILVYPAAQKGMWKTMQGADVSSGNNQDIHFFDQLLESLHEQLLIDNNRVYAVGMSNGATFVQLLAAERSKKIAAIAAHSGSKPKNNDQPERAFPVFLIAGADDIVSSILSENSEWYKENGHPFDLVIVPNLGHEWSKSHNQKLWSFLSEFSLSQ